MQCGTHLGHCQRKLSKAAAETCSCPLSPVPVPAGQIHAKGWWIILLGCSWASVSAVLGALVSRVCHRLLSSAGAAEESFFLITHWLLSSPVVSEASLTRLDSAMDEGAGSAPS